MPAYNPPMGVGGKMPMKGRRPSATKTTHTAVPQVDAEEANIQDFAPPEWRTVLNSRADLGFPDFYPSRPGFSQTEDVLTEENVKNGFSAKTFVAIGAESFSMHGPIYGHLMNGCLGMLNKLGEEIAQKRDEAMPQIGERSFRIPVRVTYNDAKRLQFLADLANPAVPLARLMRNPVPHGFKGVELFDSMFAPQLNPAQNQNRSISGTGPAQPPQPIPLDRAIWFIRVLGANEISAHRGRVQPVATPVAAPSPVPATPSSTNTAGPAPAVTLSSNEWYTQEFTNMFTSWLRIQLGQLTLPTKATVKSGVPAPKAPPGVLGDEKARARWSAKWNYSLKLLQELRAKRLFSTRLFVSWLVETLSSSNMAQIGFIVQLIGDHLPDVSKHTTIARPCIRVACAKLHEICAGPAVKSMVKVVEMLRFVIQSLFDANPLVLQSPLTWRAHQSTIRDVLLGSTNDDAGNQNTGTLRANPGRQQSLARVQRRSSALDFHPTAAESSASPRRQQMEDLRKLDAMDADTNMITLCKTYFDGGASPLNANVDISRLEEKTFVLLNWAMGLFQLGVHRAYAVDTLLTIWTNIYAKTQAKTAKPVEIDFFCILYKWLDTCEAPRQAENAFAIGITFGDLTRQGLFSYRRYLQVIIAGGHSARSRLPGSEPSHHLPLLAAMPIFVQAKELQAQRKLALCGDDEEAILRLDTEEERLLGEYKQAVQEYIPEMFGINPSSKSKRLRDVVYHQMPAAPALNRYLFLQARFWLAPAAANSLQRQGDRPPIDASAFVRILHVFQLCNGFSTRADFLIKALEVNDDEEILNVIIDSIRRDADVWTANDKWLLLTNALMDRNQVQDARGKHHSGLANLLLELARRGRLPEEDEDEVKSSIKRHPKAVPIPNKAWTDSKESMGPLVQAISSGNISAAMAMALKLFSRHGSFTLWSAAWWANIIRGIQIADTRKSAAVANAVLGHIEEVLKQNEDDLDPVLLAWLDTTTELDHVELLAGKSAPIIIDVLLNLVARRRLHTVPRLLDRLSYAIWKHAGNAIMASKGHLSNRNLRASEHSIILAQHLLLTQPPNSELPPINLQQSLIIQTERRAALNGTNVPLLIRHLPFLVVIDTARETSNQVREQISTLLQGLATTPQFKAAAFRHLNILKDAFLSNEWSKPSLSASIETAMVDALKLIMSPGTPSTSAKMDTIASLDSSSRFSAWRWTSIVLGMRVEFKRLALRIENGDNAAEAKQTLNRLVHATLDREATADDTDLLCEAFRGIEHVAAQEIIAVGLERLTLFLSQILSAESPDTLPTLVSSVDLMLRVLDSAMSTPSASGTTDLSVLAARHGLLDLASVALQSIERQMISDDEGNLPDGVVPPKPGEVLAVIIKMLKFVLGLPIADNASPVAPRPDFGRLASCFLRVIVALSSAASQQTIQMMVDLLTYIVDCAPPISRNPVHMALMSEMTSASTAQAITKHPIIASALPWTSPPRRPTALVSSGLLGESCEASLTLDDRPWEMFEHFDPPNRQTPYGERFLASKPLKDMASIPMSLFGPRIKRDAVPNSSKYDPTKADEEKSESDAESLDPRPWEAYASERNLGDGQAGEPISMRQMVTSLYTGMEEITVEDDNVTVHSAVSPADTIVAAPHSPATSTNRPRRASTRVTSGSVNVNTTGGAANGPATNNLGSNRNPITLAGDEDESEEDSDDSPEVIERPVGKRPRTGGKTIGGKTTRKTTGGKGVARKGTGGKSVRGVSGKGVRGGRR